MTIPAQHGRTRPSGRGPIVGSLLAVVILIPVGALFVAHWRDLSEQRSFARQERQGIEYLMALSQLTVALTDAQSAVVAGQPISSDALTRAVEVTAEADRRLGVVHRVSERWSQLRDTIEELARTEFADPREAYAGYGEATDLLLDLHGKLRETSGLIRDADADTYYLQDGAGEELPETIVEAGRLVDLVTIAVAGPASEQAASTADISVARVSVTGPAEDLAGDLQAALDSTESRTLSSSVLSRLDRFLREKDALLAAVPPDGDPATVDAGQLAVLRIELQAAATDLVTALMVEMDSLIARRVDVITGRQWTAAIAAAAAVLLILGLVWLNLAPPRRRRPARTPEPTRAAGPAPPDVVHAELVDWQRSGAR